MYSYLMIMILKSIFSTTDVPIKIKNYTERLNTLLIIKVKLSTSSPEARKADAPPCDLVFFGRS